MGYLLDLIFGGDSDEKEQKDAERQQAQDNFEWATRESSAAERGRMEEFEAEQEGRFVRRT